MVVHGSVIEDSIELCKQVPEWCRSVIRFSLPIWLLKDLKFKLSLDVCCLLMNYYIISVIEFRAGVDDYLEPREQE